MQYSICITDAQQLATLLECQLNDMANNIAQALDLVTNAEKFNKAGKGSQNKLSIYKCEHLGCNTTFHCNKDRMRHVRNQPTDNAGLVYHVIYYLMCQGLFEKVLRELILSFLSR